VPGYEPFLLCDFHVHTRWSDGRLSVREVVDLYGRTGKFDVIAITDHILMSRDILKRVGHCVARTQALSVTEDRFAASGRHSRRSRTRAARMRHAGAPGAEVTQNHFRSSKNSHIIALNITDYISADQPAEAFCAKSAGKAGSTCRTASSNDTTH
jgi:histidinol phosphatase-like PHP family hydrolase